MKNIFVATVILLLFTSCTKNSVGANEEELLDPEGTVWVNLNHGAVYMEGNCGVVWTKYDNNLGAACPDCQILMIGNVNGLGNVNVKKSLPSVGWSMQSACLPGYAYVVRCCGIYLAIYVVDYIYDVDTSIRGINIKACPFTPGVGFN